MYKNKLGKSFFYKGFRKKLATCFGKERTAELWTKANDNLNKLEQEHPEISGDAKMMILPAAAIYKALLTELPDAVPMMKEYGMETGEKIAKVIHAVTSVPGISRLLWRNMPKLMRNTSSPEKGYTRRIVSETDELVGVDILSCPLHDAAIKIGVPEAVQVVCAMDKAYMSGFKYIRYTRTTSVGEGDDCCDYRLSYDKSKR